MGRKNRRLVEETFLPQIKEDKRQTPRCYRFPEKTLFITGYGAQIAVDEIKARSKAEKKPERVYECKIDEGGCSYFHITSLEIPPENSPSQ